MAWTQPPNVLPLGVADARVRTGPVLASRETEPTPSNDYLTQEEIRRNAAANPQRAKPMGLPIPAGNPNAPDFVPQNLNPPKPPPHGAALDHLREMITSAKVGEDGSMTIKVDPQHAQVLKMAFDDHTGQPFKDWLIFQGLEPGGKQIFSGPNMGKSLKNLKDLQTGIGGRPDLKFGATVVKG